MGESKLRKTWLALTLYAVVVILMGSGLASCVSPPTPLVATATPLPPSPTVTATATPVAPTAVPTATPLPTLGSLPVPTPPAGGVLLTVGPDLRRTGWFGSKEIGPHWRDRDLLSGVLQGQTFLGVIQFDLQNLAPHSEIVFAALEITTRDASKLQSVGEWTVDLIAPTVIEGIEPTFAAVNQTPTLGRLAGPVPANSLATGLTKRFIFSAEQIALLEQQLDTGKITLRLMGPTSGTDNILSWDAGPGPAEPTLYVLTVPAPFVVITNTPAPRDIFSAATLVAQQTLQARQYGTPTRLPRAFVTATPTPTRTPMVVITSAPTAASTESARATAIYATAIAATTGTPTPLPPGWVTATPRPLIIPLASLTPVPSLTPTVIRPSEIELARMPLPAGLYNKILFLGNPRDEPLVWMMNPDGSNIALVTDRRVYDIARARETISVDGTLHVFQKEDLNGQLQLWAENLHFPNALPLQLTYLRRYLVFAPAWSPVEKKIAYTSSETGRQEIWVHTLEPATWKRLTVSDEMDCWWNQNPSFSPDGKQIVFSSDRGHDATFSEIWVMDADGSHPRKLGNGVWDAYWPVWVKWER